MASLRTLSHLCFVSASLVGCASDALDDENAPPDRRDDEIEELARLAGAPVAYEVGDSGATRVIQMTPGFPVAMNASDKILAAQNFVAIHHDAFGLEDGDADTFVVGRIDRDAAGDVHHVTLQRTFAGIPVFQGAITVHMDRDNKVFRALGDDEYVIAAPKNTQSLKPLDAAIAAGRAFGLEDLAPTQVASAGIHTTFSSQRANDPIEVEPRIVQVGTGDHRFAYQVTLPWLDENRVQRYELALVDAADGTLLRSYNLVNQFTGRVFSVNAQPTAGQTADTRVIESFDGNPAASPQGWVDASRRTVGNNIVAATDLNGDNNVGTNEIQPTANGSDSFDFPYSGTTDASSFKDAAVANAFFLANDFHDRTYLLGFTEASGNFQSNNFGKGGVGNDPVNVDAQDGSGQNNANFSTPPDGSRPRMQMFLFTITGGAREDGDFDPTVIYHENAHGLSNRLVGGGSTGCLFGLQSGGMGEGWSDFMAATFLNNPVIGAYVTGDAVNGIRQFPMDTAPWTYNDIKNGTLGEVHDVGELWAATLFDLREAVGVATVEQLVVSGMKLTPCSPTMLNARDGILQADQNINGGANRCAIFQVFAGRLMGTGASSPNHNSTSTIVTSTAVPPECQVAQTVFADDFESDKGWVRNPNGTDTATAGRWERGDPKFTSSSGTKQRTITPSGVNDLVTGAAAGPTAGTNDVDGGTTTIQSPPITLPSSGKLEFAASFYFSHRDNSSNADFFRIEVVGATTATIFEERGSATDDDAVFVRQSFDISQFAGQTVRILITAADNPGGSLVEAAVDDVTITRQ
jgi:extracellular elastinolytic metalloproteinase